MNPQKNIILYFVHNLAIATGLVVIGRGVWHLLDIADFLFFGGNQLYTAIGGIIIGLAILYIPDKDLKELGKL